MKPDRNVVLIGMPGAGKSTVGVLLAKAAGRDFIDTDLRIQSATGKRLQAILGADGMEAFRRIEEEVVLALDVRGAVVATGGSVVYSPRAMAHLRRAGTIVHLELAPELLRARLTNLGERGVVMAPGQTIESLHAERTPLYRQYADVTVDCAGLDHLQVVGRVVAALGL